MVLEGKISWVTNSHLGQWPMAYVIYKSSTFAKVYGVKKCGAIGNILGNTCKLDGNPLGTQ
jgi:hypothetical protein